MSLGTGGLIIQNVVHSKKTMILHFVNDNRPQTYIGPLGPVTTRWGARAKVWLETAMPVVHADMADTVWERNMVPVQQNVSPGLAYRDGLTYQLETMLRWDHTGRSGRQHIGVPQR